MSQTRHLLIRRAEPKLLSIVIPLYNEEAVIPHLRTALDGFLQVLQCPYEVILANDGSSDATVELLWQWAETDRRIKVVNLARNFGHQAAVTAGLDAAKGDAVVVMDADLQDPPEVVHEMIRKYCEGYDVVYGQREEREGETFFKKASAWIFYRMMRTLVHRDLPADAGDFRLISRRCLDSLMSMRETHRFLRGMGAWVGFPQCPVRYKRSPRAAGETKYPLSKMLRFAWTAAVSFSTAPLILSLWIGVVVAALGAVIGIYASFQGLKHLMGIPMAVDYSPGWATLVTLICLIGGSILICLGIIGEYIGRIFDEAKDRPLYIVSETKNLSVAADDATERADDQTLYLVKQS